MAQVFWGRGRPSTALSDRGPRAMRQASPMLPQPHDTKMDTGADAGADTDAAPRRAVHEVADAVEMGVLVHQLAAAAPK